MAKLRTNHKVSCFGRPDGDITQLESVKSLIEKCKPDVVVNAAAYTAVDDAETDIENAYLVNATGSENLAVATAEREIPLIHISTDYVFDGSKTGAYVEDDQTNPLGVYGASKLAGEITIAENNPNHAILRTSWVYGAEGKNFLKTMLRLSQTNDALNIVSDQTGCPTTADEIAAAINVVASALTNDTSGNLRGTFHFAGVEAISWADFARLIFHESSKRGGKLVTVSDIPTEDFPTPAARPKNSVLDCTKINTAFDIQQKSLSENVRETLGPL